MPVELTIVESVTELETTVTEIILESNSEPGPAGPGVPTGGTDGQVLTKTSGVDYATAWEDPTGGAGGGAPDDATYLVTTAHDDLSAEVAVGATPGGELGGTWASPTVDATHSGSSHAGVQAAAEATAAAALSAHVTDTTDAHAGTAITNTPAGNIAATTVQAAINELDSEKAAAAHAHAGEDITSGTVADARIASTIARDSEVSSAISTSEAGQVRDGDAAGGVLGGTYPSPSFAVDMATQAELDAHISDSSAAHAASAVSADSTTLVGTGTDVQAVLEELDNGIADHLADSSAAHAASAISASSATLSGTGTDVQAVLEELDNLLDDHSSRHENGGADEISIAGLDGTPTELTNHLSDSSDAHDASAISVADSGGYFAGSDVEAVLADLGLARADGWVPSQDTWTYASATTFTIAGVDRTTTFTKGTRIKLTQTSAKYFVVVASSFSTNTTVTITGGTDYTLANAAITSPHYSYAANPQGYPSAFSYTPTFGGFSSPPASSLIFYFSVVGRTCFVNLYAGTEGTSNATTFTVTLPIAPDSTLGYATFVIRVRNNSAWLTTPGIIVLTGGTTTADLYRDTSGATWTNSGGKTLQGHVTYVI